MNPKFIFSAYSNALGASFHQPVKSFLSDGPSAALPTSGGAVSSSKLQLAFTLAGQSVIHARRLSASVFGEERDDSYVSVATSVVEELNLFNIVTADKVVSRVTAVYSKRSQVSSEEHGSRFFFTGSYFENLRILGQIVNCEYDTKEDFTDGLVFPRNERGRTHPLITELDRSIPGIGHVSLWKVDAYASKVILTMVQVELGSAGRIRTAEREASPKVGEPTSRNPVIGTVAAGTASSNGTNDHGGPSR